MKNILLLISFILVFALPILAQTNQGMQTDSIVFKEPQLILEAVAGDAPGQFGFTSGFGCSPQDFIVDPYGNIWIMDIMNRRVQKFDKKGDFILQFPDSVNKIPIALVCSNIECNLEGQIVVGPMPLGDMVVLNNNGKFLRIFKLPGIQYTELDFSITASGELLYLSNTNDLVAVNLYGKVLYAIPNGPLVSGRDVSPYSQYVVSPALKLNKINIYRGDLRKQQKTSIDKNRDLNSQDAKYITAFHADNNGNFFIGKIIEQQSKMKFVISFHQHDGTYIQTLENLPEASNEKNSFSYHTVDADGSLYVMKIQFPEGTEIIPDKLIKGGTPCLRIWKWERIKE
jgi:hypothetical protein